MKLTLGQIKEMLPISQDTYRHWKSTLPPLRGRNGYTRCFSHGDLLAMAVVRALTESVGIRVGKLDELSVELFRLCGSPWTALERSMLIIEPLATRLTIRPESHLAAIDALTIVMPLRPIIATLRDRLLLEDPGLLQEPLRFPPAAVGGTRRKGRP